MQIVVCIKSVMIRAVASGEEPALNVRDLNPFDRPVIETALRIRAARGGMVTALSMGPESGISAMAEARAMGVDRGVMACDPRLKGSDTLATSLVLARAIERLAPFDLVLFGTRTSDSDTGQVGPQTAMLLNIPLVSRVQKVEHGLGGLRVGRIADGFVEEYELSLPAALTIDPGWMEPRDISLAGIQEAFEDERVERWDLDYLGLSPHQVGEAGSPTTVISVTKAARRKGCEFIKGDLRDQVEDLIGRLTRSGMIG